MFLFENARLVKDSIYAKTVEGTAFVKGSKDSIASELLDDILDFTGLNTDALPEDQKKRLEDLKNQYESAKKTDPQEAKEIKEEIDKLLEGTKDCKSSDISYGGRGFICKRCGDSASAVKDIKHKVKDADEVSYKGYTIKVSAQGEEIDVYKDGKFQFKAESQKEAKDIIDGKAEDAYTGDPLTAKGEKIMSALKKEYGDKKGEEMFYKMRNSGKINKVDPES